jgi:AcrR family transcriptional regulator
VGDSGIGLRPTAHLLYRPDGIVNEAKMAGIAAGRVAGLESRRRIMTAAAELAIERGPGNISIEAVAERAGLSKGGVLYHFRTKADLLEALVASHVEDCRCQVGASLGAECDGPNALAEALIAAHRGKAALRLPAASGLLAAISEDPGFLDPMRAYQTETLARLRRESADPELALIAFLALEGLKTLHLFGFEGLEPGEEEGVLARMTTLLGTTAQAGPA